MRLVMMGTGPFAVPTFQRLYETAHQVAALVTQPPREAAGRRAAAPSPLREVAQQHGTPVFDPPDVNAAEFQPTLQGLEADLWVVADYGQILSRETLALARLGGINLHGSLLPRYRGAAPIQWALYHGETVTGVSVIHMTPRLDAGPVLAQRQLEIDPQETAPELEARLASLGAPLVAETIERLAAGQMEPLPQDPALATGARRLRKTDGAIDWRRPAPAIASQVRALEPWPRNFTFWHRPDGSTLRLILGRVRVGSGKSPLGLATAAPGSVLVAEAGQLAIATGQGWIEIESAQPAGRQPLSTDALLRGYPIRAGERLGPETGSG